MGVQLTMKRILALGLAIILLFGLYQYLELDDWVAAQSLNLEAESAILIDADTGKVIFAYNADDPLPPASVSKLMTELLVLEAVSGGKVQWEDELSFSRYAASVTGAQIGLAQGETISLRAAFEATAVHSSNDAAIALAEHIAGTEALFVDRMNAKAREIGLSHNTRFANASGLSSMDLMGRPDAGKYNQAETRMTARDIAKLASHLIKEYPEILEVTSRSQVELAGMGTLSATNWMLPGERYAYPGNDGLKTGYTEAAGYCFVGTTHREGRRLVSVVMKTPTKDARFTETKKLFEYGFN